MYRLLLGAHFGIFIPSAVRLSNTYTGHPQTCKSWNLFWGKRCLVNLSNEQTPVSGDGTRLKTCTACFTAIGHNSTSDTSGQCIAECIIIVRAIEMMVRMLRSATPLWWCAPGPANLLTWLNSFILVANSCEVNAAPLSDRYVCGITPKSDAIASNLSLACNVSNVFKCFCNSTCTKPE